MSKFLSNSIKLFSATLAGQILGIIVTPFLSRLYSPSDFGIFQLFFSLAPILTVFSCLSYSYAIQLPKKDEDAANIVVLCALLIVITTIFTTIFFFFFSDYIEQQLTTPGLSTYFFLLPFAIISSSTAMVLKAWQSRKNDFNTIATSNFYSSVSGKGISLGFGIISPSPFGLILGTITNDATIALVLLKKTISDFHLFQKISYEKIRQLAHRYKNFPKYQIGADLAATTAAAVPSFMLAFFFSMDVVGFFAMAFMVIRLPSKLLASAIYQVFYQKACDEKNRTGSIKIIVEIIHTRLISLGMFACLIVMIIGPELFTFALGIQWTTAGVYAQIIAPWMFVAFISIPLLAIFSVFEKQAQDLWFSVLQLLTRLIAILIGGLLADPILAIVLLSIGGVLDGCLLNFYTIKIAGASVLDTIKEIVHYFLISLLFCLPLIIAKYYSISTTFLIVIATVLSIFYYTVIIFRDPPLKQGLIESLKNIIQK